MPTVSAIGTNFNLPQYHGIVHPLTPSDTPFTTALMGTAEGGGEVESARTFEWSTSDLRDAAQNTVVDGDRAGTGEVRSRGNVFNVLQTHREDVDVSYERLAQTLQFDGQNIGGGAAIIDEESWQIEQMWKQIKRDIEYSLINGTYVLPGTNGTAAQTRGILEAISTNTFTSYGTTFEGATGETIDDVFDVSNSLSDGQDVVITSLTGGSNLATDTRYFVVNATGAGFQIAATKGGAALDFGSDVTDATISTFGEPDTQSVEALMQSAWDNGGLQESDMGLLIVNSTLKRWLTKVFITDPGATPRSRTVGGANVEVITTSFGDVGIMLNRYIPQGTLAAVSLDQCKPHFRLIPGKGVMFAEPTSKAGASNATQLYASVGLEYGNEAAHAKDTGFTTNAPTAA